MRFEPGLTREEIIAQKRQRVQQRQAEYFQFWLEHVATRYAESPAERHDPS
jgi:hypothetical protein